MLDALRAINCDAPAGATSPRAQTNAQARTEKRIDTGPPADRDSSRIDKVHRNQRDRPEAILAPDSREFSVCAPSEMTGRSDRDDRRRLRTRGVRRRARDRRLPTAG